MKFLIPILRKMFGVIEHPIFDWYIQDQIKKEEEMAIVLYNNTESSNDCTCNISGGWNCWVCHNKVLEERG